jgi:hypothetical protein
MPSAISGTPSVRRKLDHRTDEAGLGRRLVDPGEERAVELEQVMFSILAVSGTAPEPFGTGNFDIVLIAFTHAIVLQCSCSRWSPARR